MDEYENTIVDSSKPNAGRVYDYLIGGTHNFEIDRQMGDNLMKMAPFISNGAKFVRWFLHEAIRRANERGFTQFLDFASGLPVEDHIHNNTPKGTKVIYSDIDPVTVKYAKNIIGENPLVKYETCDAATPEKLLESNVVISLFGSNHKTAIGFSGICWFLTNEQINHAMKILYEWADNGSMLFLTDIDSGDISDGYKSMLELYVKMKQPSHPRTKKEFLELIEPWEVEEPGFLPLEKWYDLAPTVTKEIITFTGGSGPFGGFLKK